MSPLAAIAALKSLAGRNQLRRGEQGQDLLEYGLLAALIALVAFGAVTSVGTTIHEVFWTVIASSA